MENCIVHNATKSLDLSIGLVTGYRLGCRMEWFVGIRDGHVWHVPGFLIHISKLDILTKDITNEIKIHRPKLRDFGNGIEQWCI